jgi:hypothetical protein
MAVFPGVAPCNHCCVLQDPAVQLWDHSQRSKSTAVDKAPLNKPRISRQSRVFGHGYIAFYTVCLQTIGTPHVRRLGVFKSIFLW